MTALFGVRASIVGGILVLGLAGCAETGVGAAGVSQYTARLAIPVGATPRAATVAFASVDGAPEPVLSAMYERLAAEAASRDVTVTDAKSARYLVRGYLSAAPAGEGTSVAYVWDVFDAGKNRIQRVENAVIVRGSSGNPWAAVDAQAVARLASESAGDLAAILANMPEANASAPAAAIAAATGSDPAPSLPAAASAYR